MTETDSFCLGFPEEGGFKPAEIQEGAGAGLSYTLVSALVTEWFDKENTIYGYLATGL